MDLDVESAVTNFEYDGEDFTIPLNNVMLRGCEWRPESGHPEFILVYVYGLGSFVTANHSLVDVVIARGGAFICCDHLGHGRSPGPRCSCTISEICEETELVIKKARESFPDTPIFLYGTSMGGLSAIQLVFEQAAFTTRNLRGVIIGCPLLSNSTSRPITLFESFAIMLGAKFMPNFLVKSGTDSRDPDINREFANKLHDCPLFAPYITPRLLDSALRAMTKVRQHSECWPSDLPVLFLQGSADTIVDPVVNEAWFKALRESSAQNIVEIKIYERASHGLLKGQCRPIVLQDILDFINKLK
jgi:acylglycerol lipase